MSFRTLTVYLALAVLLLGNVAGWVHVGCSNCQTGCCSVTSAATTSVAAPAATSTTPEADACCCCQNRQIVSCPIGTPLVPTESEPSDSNPPAESESPAEPHDPENCSVCQSFFATRDAVVSADAVVVNERAQVSRDVASIDDVFAPSQLHRSQTVRGPPIA